MYSIHNSFWLNRFARTTSVPSSLSGAGTVFGILLGVASPAAGAAAWLILTYSYRQAKRRTVLGVLKYLRVKDIAEASGPDAANAAPNPYAMVEMVALDGRQLVRQASSESLLMLHIAVVPARARFASSLSAEHIGCDAQQVTWGALVELKSSCVQDTHAHYLLSMADSFLVPCHQPNWQTQLATQVATKVATKSATQSATQLATQSATQLATQLCKSL